MHQLVRYVSNPVLTKGATFGGWQADALAAPGLCWDGSWFVLSLSLWNIALANWATAFFTSTDFITWSYVTRSLWAPSGANYIVGNGGLEWFGGKYWFAYTEAPSAVAPAKIAHSTNLTAWTALGTIIPTTTGEDTTGQCDPTLRYNPHSGLLECWFVGQDNRKFLMADSPDGSTWTARGVKFTPANPYHTDAGTPEVCYPPDGSRLLFFDAAFVTGRRHTFLGIDPDRVSGFTVNGSVNGPSAVNAWENTNVFDCSCPGAFDLGSGSRLYVLYAGSDVVAATDDTDSSMGMAFHAVTGAPSGQPAWRRLGGVAGARPVEIGRGGVRVYRTMPPELARRLYG